MKNKKGLIFVLIILMSVGFAAVTTTLIINGRTIVAENEEDYQVYFSGAIVDKEDYTNEIISKDKKTITFETKKLMKENDTSELKYDVTNGSTQYDASVSIKVSTENDDLIEVKNTYDDSKNLSARETRTGVLTVRLKKGATEAKDVKIKVELIFNAEEREEIDTTPITSKVYSISGYFVDKEGNAMPNANIAVFSENPQFVTTDDYGYFYVGNLERGNHELYYIEKTDVNKTKEEIKKNAIDETNVTTSSTKTIVFDNGHEIKDKVVGEENNKTFKITLVKNNGEADEEIEVRENSKYENLPIPNKVGTKFLYWKDENGKIITENTIVSQTKTNKLYAYYGENTYRIAYNLNGGILNNQVTQAKYGIEITLENPSKTIKVTINDNNEGSTISENEISKILTFKGWSGKDISGTAVSNGAPWNGSIIKATTFKNLTDEQDKTVTLEANFEDTTITLPEVTKNGYTCKIKDGETTYEPSATYPIKGTDTNKELTVECGANTYKIVYNANGGTGSMDATTCTYDKDCTLRANTLTKTGYTFDHWEVNGNSYKNQATVKNLVESGNVELKAIWKANTYKIAYNLNGGTSSNAPTGATFDKDVTIANPTKEVTVTIDGNNQGATLVKTSYTGNPVFTGWTGSSLSNTALVNNVSWNGTLTKETKFKNLTSTLNGIVTLTANYNETSITLDAPTKAGYTCGYTDTATGAIKYTTSITVSDNKTIYVKCNPNTYTINFDSDGGTTVSSKTATYDSKIGTLTNPTKTGYNFAGWYLDTESITSESVYKYAKDITLKAKWTEATNTKYTVNYYLQTLDKKYDKVTESVVYTGTTNKTVDAALKTYEGFVTPSKQTVKILADGSAKVDYYYVRKELKVTFVNGDTKKEVTYLYGKENQAFTNNGFTKTGYTLTGYSNTSGGSKNYEVTSTITGEFIDKHYPSKTVYVVFTANTYKVVFNNNGGSGSMDTITCTYDKDCTLTKNAFTKTGYTFAGWSKTSTGAIEYTNGSTVKNLATSGSITLYAKWTANTYTVSYNANGGTGTMSKTTCTYDTNCTIAANSFTRTGYTFASWTKDSTTGTSYAAGSTVKNLATSGNVNMYAKWTTNTYKIAYTMNNGSLGTNKPTSASYDANVLIDNPTKNLTVTINANNQGATISKTSVSQVQTFNGWTVSGLNTNTAKTGTASNAITTAYTGTSTKNTYFKNLTATNNGTVTFTANWTNTAVILPTITKTGYTCGYATSASGSIAYASGSTYTPSGETSKTLYAKCNANTYTITYNSNGGSGTTEKTTCTYDTDCTISANSFTRTGYTFANWTKDSTSGTAYAVGATVKNLATSGNVNMYAKWTANTYKIAYTMNNGTQGTNKPTSGTYNANVLIDNPTKNLTVTINANSQGATISATSVTQAQTFSGWTVTGLNTSTAKTGTSSSTVTTAYTGTSTKNTYFKNLTATKGTTVTFTANWTNTAVTLPTITKTGYTCGYSTSASGSIAYASGSKYTPNGETSKTLYAKCNANTYTITYNSNGGSGTMSKTTCTYNTNCTLSANSFTKDGYAFVSWTKDSTSGTEYTAGSTVKNLATSGNVNMYAKWEQLGKNLYNLIKNQADKTTVIDYSVGSQTSGTNGIYTTTDTDGNVPVYYYRGDADKVNNNIIFNNMCWKIIRTTEAGGIKIMYNGVPTNGKCENQTELSTQIGDSAFNENLDDNAYVGYMYGTAGSSTYEATHANINDSTIKKYIDNWYSQNFDETTTSKLEDTVFCNDRSTKAYDPNTINSEHYSSYGDLGYGTNKTLYAATHRAVGMSLNLTPTLKCQNENDKFTVSNKNGNGKLIYPVGLINVDEIVFAGLAHKADPNIYINNTWEYWVMTPEYFDYDKNGNLDPYIIFIETSDDEAQISSDDSTAEKGVRPVISLKNGTLVSENGDGTSANPYIVK